MVRRGTAVVLLCLAVLAASALAYTPIAAAQSGTTFEDVADGAYYAEPVVALAGDGVLAGTLCEEGFCPGEPIDRKTMAVWVVRVLDGADPSAVSQTRFDDVDADSFNAPFIERLHQLGVTRGCGDGRGFCPHDNVTRAQMAAFVSRAFKLPDGTDPDFADVPATAWYAADVAKLAASGITRGCGDGRGFCPHDNVTRAEMATFLWRGQIGAAEAEMARLVNELRSSLGLVPLTVHTGLSTVARSWSMTMRDRGIFEHNPNYAHETRYALDWRQYPISWSAGENIAFNEASGRTIMDAVQVAFDGLAGSPGHYANMTYPDFNLLGVGIAVEDSSFWFTQNFAYWAQ